MHAEARLYGGLRINQGARARRAFRKVQRMQGTVALPGKASFR